jgi:hypothetical protein
MIPQDFKPVEGITIEFYTSSLSMSMDMFVKNTEKASLEETFQEALKIEKNMLSLKGNIGGKSSKDKAKTKAKSPITNSS